MADQTTSIVIVARPDAELNEDCFTAERGPVPRPGDGEFLIETQLLSINPPSRMTVAGLGNLYPQAPLGEVMTGAGLGRVVESNHPHFAVGDLVSGQLGWREHVVSDGARQFPVQKFTPEEGIPLTVQFGAGGSAATAYVGLFQFGEPKFGDVVVVSTAAGSVGSIVCQLAKRAGCTVIGLTGTDDKCDYLTKELGIDHAVNYRTDDVDAALTKLCPRGLNIFFDNTGGPLLDIALDHLAMRARVVVCGFTSQYDAPGEWYGPKNYYKLVAMSADMRGFFIGAFARESREAARRLAPLWRSGELTHRVDVVDGIENAPKGLVRVLQGENRGTQLVKVAADAALS